MQINNQRHNREQIQRKETRKSIHVVRKYLNLMPLSDLVHCDGRTFSEDLFAASGRAATKVTFPKENPTSNYTSLWRQFLDSLTDGRDTLLAPLKEYISSPHAKLHW